MLTRTERAILIASLESLQQQLVADQVAHEVLKKAVMELLDLGSIVDSGYRMIPPDAEPAP